MSKSKFPHDKYPELAPKVCIRKYLVNGETGMRNGLLLAFPDPNNYDNYTIGYAVTHPLDKWSKTKAIQLALDRACTLSERWPKVPKRIKKALPRFLERCNRFFKGLSGPEWVNEALYPGYRLLVEGDWQYASMKYPGLEQVFPDLWEDAKERYVSEIWKDVKEEEKKESNNIFTYLQNIKSEVEDLPVGPVYTCSQENSGNCCGIHHKKSLVPSDFPVDKVERIE